MFITNVTIRKETIEMLTDITADETILTATNEISILV